jgi:hypothetical protein
VELAPGVIAVRFARRISGVLNRAHERGLSDEDIATITTVGKSTFHRWQSGQLGKSGPQPAKVRAFFIGLGEDVNGAYQDLGWAVEKAEPIDESMIMPEFRDLMRGLRDPNVSSRDKEFIMETVRMLILRLRQRPRAGSTPTSDD